MDTFLNASTEDFTLDFTWPDTDDVLFDDTAPRLEKVLVKDGHVELELTEEPDLASTDAILIDGEPVVWELDESRYKLVTTASLEIGAHTFEVGTGLTDLAGHPITEPFANPIAIDPLIPRWVVYLAPDPREVSASTINNTLGFHGLEHDPETGLVYVRNRYFDPELGRFISQDPLGYIDGPSLYGFASNSPLSFGDPLGEQALPAEAVPPAVQPEHWRVGAQVISGGAAATGGAVSAVAGTSVAAAPLWMTGGVAILGGAAGYGFGRGSLA